MAAECLHSGCLLRHSLAPLLGSGLALLAPFWRLPAQIPALALPGPLSSPRNTILASAVSQSAHSLWVQPACDFTLGFPPWAPPDLCF